MFEISNFRFYLIIFLFVTILTGCPVNHEKKEAREIFQNKMNFNFNDNFNIHYNGLDFQLPKKFTRNYNNYQSILTNGSERRTFNFEELSLYFGISEIKREELSNILFIHDLSNPIDAVLQDAALKRKESIYHTGRVSEVNTFKCKLRCKLLSVLEPFHKTYSWEQDYSSLYYIASVKKNNRFYVLQFCGKSDKMIYFLDDFKQILRSMK